MPSAGQPGTRHCCNGSHASRRWRRLGAMPVGGMTRAIRIVFGAALVAAGAALLQPLGSLVAAGYARSRMTLPVEATPASPAPPAAEPTAQGAVSWLVPEKELPPPVTLAPGYVPPPAPERLPPVPAVAAAAPPDMNGTYRSTLAVPPPPLLDVHGVDARPVESPAFVPPPLAAASLPPAVAAGGVLPATHVVADGDDLTGIAARIYGHPGAAAAVWAANRDILQNPDLLPIGAELRLPPPWAVGASLPTSAAARSIEPNAGSPPAPHAGSGVAESAVTGPAAWLTAAPTPTTPPALAAPRPARPAAGTVRLAPGETLASLAEKLYGDRSAALRIWEANRDRLRSPDLAVAGMELRLP